MELMNTTTQTPIEIALGIDEKGMTTARKLYDFLELAQGQFSRWCKRNIIENEFAEEIRIICESTLMSRRRQVALFNEKIIKLPHSLQRNFPCSPKPQRVNRPVSTSSK